MRGKPTPERGEGHRFRITPAGAGKTTTALRALVSGEDHPRRCGENIQPTPPKHDITGSPPQVRGKLGMASVLCITIRITPAGAGKTSYIKLIGSLTTDHPRRCGENFFSGKLDSDFPGSPPQVRGKHCSFACLTYSSGITPAGAGKTTAYGKYNMENEDHPRRCGENSHPQLLTSTAMGSPPQVRGKL